MIKRLFIAMLAILFPWIILLINDNPGGAVIALIMQASVIGWIPASMWAWRVSHPKKPSKTTHSETKE